MVVPGDSEPGSLPCPLSLPCAQVLTDEGGESQREAGDRQETESLDLGIRSASCNSHLSELVNISLDEYIRNGYDGVLQSGRESVGQKLSQHLRIDPYLSEREAELCRAVQKLMQAQAKELLKDLNCENIDTAKPVKYLGVAEQQMIEIAKAISVNPKIIIFDEPTVYLI